MPYEQRDGYRIDTLSSGRPKWVPPHEKVLDTASQMMYAFVHSTCGNTITESNIEMAARGIMAYLCTETEANSIIKDFDVVFQEEIGKMTEADGSPKEIRKTAYNRAWTRLLCRAMANVNKYAEGLQAEVCVVRRKSHDRNGNEINVMIPEDVEEFIAENPLIDDEPAEG